MKNKTYVLEKRKEKGIGIVKLARLAGVGTATIMGLEENSNHDPQVGTLLKIAKVLDVKFIDLINFEAYEEARKEKQND